MAKNQHKQHIRYKRQVELTLLHHQPLIANEVVWVHTDEWHVDGDGSGDKWNGKPASSWWVLELFPAAPLLLSLSIHPGSNYHQLEPLTPSSLNIAKTSVRMHCVSFRWHQSKQFFASFFLLYLYLSELPTLKNGKNDSDQNIY